MSAQVLAAEAVSDAPLTRLPLATLYLTERCNSRCLTCDYWRHGRIDMGLEKIRHLLPALRNLDTRVVLLSGGEPLLNPEWPAIAQTLREAGLKLWLLTSGLSLSKHARRVAELFDAITVSLDGTDRDTYQAIRGLDAFDNVCDGIRAAASQGVAPGLRVTLQRSNFRQLPQFVSLARELGAQRISFLAVDVANPHAFARTDAFSRDLALRRDDLPVLAELLQMMEQRYAADFQSGFIAESPQKLRKILQYFGAIHGVGEYPPVRCNAPEFSAVIGAGGAIQPCFFISGPPEAGPDLPSALNSESMIALRADIRRGARPECKTCVCSMWRDARNPENFIRA